MHKTCTPLWATADTSKIEEEEEEEEEEDADFPSQTTPEAISGKALEQINVTVRGHFEIPSTIAPLLIHVYQLILNQSLTCSALKDVDLTQGTSYPRSFMLSLAKRVRKKRRTRRRRRRRRRERRRRRRGGGRN